MPKLSILIDVKKQNSNSRFLEGQIHKEFERFNTIWKIIFNIITIICKYRYTSSGLHFLKFKFRQKTNNKYCIQNTLSRVHSTSNNKIINLLRYFSTV